jgi:glyoxylase-like metal-dependent hydrolase (beta-lactamase superfamily II)
MRSIVLLQVAALLCVGRVWGHEVDVNDFKGDFALQRLTEHIYVTHGPQQFPNPETQGFMNNPGFVVTDAGVVVVDPGSSVQIGNKLLDSIAQVTDKPVVAVFNSHVHGDHWLGNQAIRQAYPGVAIYAHQRMIERVEAGEGEDWVKLFNSLTDGATAGTRVVTPNIGLHGGEVIRIGEIPFRIHHTGKAHSDTDIMVEIPKDRGIFLGDIVTNKRVQSARPQDSDILGQIKAVEFVLGTDNDWFIPGHGWSGGRALPEQQLTFLKALHASVKKHYEEGLADFEMRDLVKQDLAAYRDWYNFDELGRVISSVYLRVEEASF